MTTHCIGSAFEENLEDVRPHLDSVADVTENLFREYEDTYGLALISSVIRKCRVELTGSDPSVMPTVMERLARDHFRGLAAAGARSRSR